MLLCALFLEMDADNPRKGYSLNMLVRPADVPKKYICTICDNVVRQAVQLPELAEIICSACHEHSVQ